MACGARNLWAWVLRGARFVRCLVSWDAREARDSWGASLGGGGVPGRPWPEPDLVLAVARLGFGWGQTWLGTRPCPGPALARAALAGATTGLDRQTWFGSEPDLALVESQVWCVWCSWSSKWSKHSDSLGHSGLPRSPSTPSAPSLGVLDPTGIIAPRLPSPRVPGVQVFRGVW